MSDVSQAEYRELEQMVIALERENLALTKKNNALLTDLTAMRERAEAAERELADYRERCQLALADHRAFEDREIERRKIAERELAAMKDKANYLEHHTYCAWCGYEIDIDDKDEAGKLMAVHVEQCSAHPLAKWRETAERLKKELIALSMLNLGTEAELADAQHELEADQAKRGTPDTE